ncbi:inovirus-type Gp2 protein [Herbaspirillum sp. VT-16-41]|uniref:inovirus-type Gp2 protein n=1 Tax=Herbaspirillum sp. VT-16-41 TaxID=1953765 RepID=UPI0009D29313|nr:inovirus-type Gp2 protein [Herbaspirillum sp. VT-16-41]ONN64985.1 hypothetical protein BTM36_19385 [Herbaspirillum sp. VT-16-41]
MNDIDKIQRGLKGFVRPRNGVGISGSMAVTRCDAWSNSQLYMIEQFVTDIEKGWAGGFTEECAKYSGIKTYRQLFLGKRYYHLLNSWIRAYSGLYRYSARVQLFYEVIEAMNLFDCMGKIPFRFGDPGQTDAYQGIRYMDWFHALIENIRIRCRSREFKERERLRRVNAKRNEKTVLAMEEKMFSERGRSRWLILSLTLQYKAAYRNQITPSIVQRHREKFFSSRRSNKLIRGIKSYVCRMEQGSDTGLHLHMILFYSSDSNRDERIAKKIGEYWKEEVTQGMGEYWNSNAGWLKHGYTKHGHGVGVGQINWNDHEKREALRRNLIYLTKPEQDLMVKADEGIRTFTMGHMPIKASSGRPRGKGAALGKEVYS